MLHRVAGNHQVAKLKQNTGTHVGIPSVFDGTYFTKVKANDLFSRFEYLVEQIKNLLGFKTTLHRGSGIGTKLWIQSVDIEADVYFIRKLPDDLINNLPE